MERRLAAVMAADVVGYSRLMGANEVGTLSALRDHRRELVDTAVEEHSGRIVKQTGDGILAEFSSAASAVKCAVHIQRFMVLRNADIPDDRKIQFRIGINVGDVIFEDDDIFGDGVNIAARIEKLAKPSGIAISGSVRNYIGNDHGFSFENAGEHELKNINRPVSIFHVSLAGGSAEDIGDRGQSAHAMPSIAVLPFTNMSGDPEQEYFADGITEDIITDLSKISGLFVIGRNSVFVYKGRAVKLQEAAQELGVRYILEGSVRKSGQRVRITGQLIDGASGGHLWGERYDRDLTNIFELQDEITKAIVGQLQVKLLTSESKALGQAPTSNVDAYTYYLKGRQLYHMRIKAFVELGRRMFTKAVECDPNYARAYAGIADCNSWLNAWFGLDISTDEILGIAEKAIAIEPDLAEAHAARALALQLAGRKPEARSAFEHALALDPLCYEGHHYYARFCRVECDYQKSAHHFIRALEIRLDDYRSPLLLHAVLDALGMREERDKYLRLGLKRAEDAAAAHPENHDPLELGAAALAASGDHDRARRWLNKALAANPNALINPPFNVVCTYVQLGEHDLALDLLAQCVRNAGRNAIEWMETDPDLDPIRDDPRYKEIFKFQK